MGGKQDNSASGALQSTGNPIIDTLFGKIHAKQSAAAAPTPTQQFGSSLMNVGNQISAQNSGNPQLEQSLARFGGAAINRFGPHNNVAPSNMGGAPNLFQGYQPQMPSFGGGQTVEGGGIGAGSNLFRNRLARPIAAPAQPLPMANITPSTPGATPSLFGSK